MSTLKAEPPVVSSLEQLIVIAGLIADDAVSRYDAQARRMRQAGADKLAMTYDELVRQQREHAERAIARLSGAPTAALQPQYPPGVEGLLDEEGTDAAAPEVLDPYRIFAVAVRNGERTFKFWTYVAAHAPVVDVMRAAEYLAREELTQAALLRQRRRTSFHALRRQGNSGAAGPETLESRLAALLEERWVSARDDAERSELAALAGQARERALQLARAPFDPALQALKGPPSLRDDAWNRPGPVCEALLDSYLEFAEQGRDEAESRRAQVFAAELIACLRFLRGGHRLR